MTSAGFHSADGPVIPNFGRGSACLRHNHWFCPSWVHEHWGDTLQPALVQHVYLMLIAVGIGFGISFTLAVVAFRFGFLRGPLGAAGDFIYCLPSIALFTILLPITGITVTTIVIPLVAYTLFVLYPNILGGLRGVPPEVLESARGMGLTRTQTFWQVELPLAVPAIMAGLRVATVATIAIATIAADLIHYGLGAPIFDALNQPDIFRTELLAAGALAILLALIADALLALLQRALTPWSRIR
jgi:osmoprotectant transport system permease protein